MSSIVHTIRLVTSAKEALAEMGKYEDKIVATAQTVEKHTATLSGNKMLKSANEWTAAIAKLGGATGQLASTEQILAGASKLTASEKEKVNKIVTTAIEKYTALGTVAPRAMLDLAAATKKVEEPTESWGGKVGKAWDAFKGFAGTLGIGLGVSALMGFGKQVFDTASQIGDLSSKLGTSAEFTQRMSYVANQSGTDIDAFGKAISKMNVLLSAGDASTVEALKKAGLSFAAIRAMKPEDAFLAIATAIGKIPDPMLQAELATRLFGKSGQDLLPAMKDDIQAVAAEAVVMSDETVKRLKAAQDAWSRLADKVTTATGEMIAWMMRQREEQQRLDNTIPDLRRLKEEGTTIADVAKSIDIKSQRVIAGLPPLKDALQVERDFTAANADSTAKINKNIAALDAKTARIRALADAYTGKKLQQEINDVAAAVAKANTEGGIQIQQIPELVAKINSWRDAGMTIPPVLDTVAAKFQNLFILPTQGTSSMKSFFDSMKVELDDLNARIPDVSVKVGFDPLKSLKGLPGSIGTGALRAAQIPAKTFSESFSGYLKKSLPVDIMSAITGGGSKLQAVGSSIGGFLASPEGLGKSLTKGLTSLFGKGLGTALSSALPGIGAMVGPAVDALFGKLFGSKGRDSVESFVGKFGGFDAFHRMLGEKLPQDAERLWIALTQGVGRNNPEQAARIIDEITAALAGADEALANTPAALAASAGYQTIEQLQAVADKARSVYEYMRDSGKFSAEAIADAFEKSKTAQIAAMGDTARAQAKALDEAKSKIDEQLSELDSKRKSLMQAIEAEAPEAVMGVAERQARAQLAQLDKQKDVLDKQLADLGESTKTSLDTVPDKAKAVQAEVYRIFSQPLHVPVIFDLPNGHPGFAAAGGLVTNRGVQYLAGGGVARDAGRVLQFRPKGTDTVPAMLSPGEGVLSTRGMAALGALNRGDALAATGTDGQAVHVHYHINTLTPQTFVGWLRDGAGDQVADDLVTRLPAARRRKGIRS